MFDDHGGVTQRQQQKLLWLGRGVEHHIMQRPRGSVRDWTGELVWCSELLLFLRSEHQHQCMVLLENIEETSKFLGSTTPP